jgi:hypothetical protein
MSLLDTGANRYVSREESDFIRFDETTTRIKGTAGEARGKNGFLRPNIFGLVYGCFLPTLPPEIQRIVPWVEGVACNGWALWLNDKAGGGWLIAETGIRVRVSVHPRAKLPVINRDIFRPVERGEFCPKRKFGEEGESLVCTAVSPVSALELHRRLGHFHVPGVNFGNCPECDAAKAVRASHARERTTVTGVREPLSLIAVDLATGIPESVRGKRVCLVGICDVIKRAFVIPLCLKSEVPEEIEKLIQGIRQTYSRDLSEKVVWYLRRDCEPVLGSEQMTNLLRNLRVQDIPAVPFNPEMNGTVERFLRTLFGSVRAMLTHSDQSLWCYAAVYAGEVWNRLPKTFAKAPWASGFSPEEVLEWRTGRGSSKSDTSVLRRFGCLVWFLDQNQKPKLAPRSRRGVFLGLCPKSSGWLVGYYKESEKKGTSKFTEHSTRDVKFYESIMVGKKEWLDPVWVSQTGKDPLLEMQVGAAERTTAPCGEADNLDRRLAELGPQHESATTGRILPIESLDECESHTELGTQVEEGNDETHRGNVEPSHNARASEGEAPLQQQQQQQEVQGEEKKPDVKPVQHRGRGRPKGAKDKVKRRRRTKAELEAILKDAAAFSSVVGGVDIDEDEEFVETYVQLSVAQALKSPDKDDWSKVIDKEHARLLAYDTWRPATDVELANARQVLPIAIVLTKKRDGSFKARACVLGNLDRAGGIETFAPVVSQAANRLLLVSAAAEGDHVVAFDLDSAFLNADLERDVLVRLPPIWAEGNAESVVKLKKALYGLRDSPKAWFKKYHSILTQLGWIECQESPGLWKKESAVVPGRHLKMSVYVDDNIMTGPNEEELHRELEKVLEMAPGRVISCTNHADSNGDVWKIFDFLGAMVWHCRAKKSMRLSMAHYIEKAAARFKIAAGKPVHSPNFDESAFSNEDSKEIAHFPLREIAGALQWVACTARPDICVPAAALARHCGKPANHAVANACKKVMKFLLTTKDEGISHSPEREEDFAAIYAKLPPPGRSLPEPNLFSDASFASCLKTMRSTSGGVMHFRGTPAAWRSNRQSARAHSTAESEHIAASDAIVLSEQNSFTDFFTAPPKNMIEANYGMITPSEKAILWVDNQSAIATAKDSDLKPKSRHYALRYLRVRDYAEQIMFCPTNLMKADGLTKLECSTQQRRLLLHHVDNPRWEEETEEHVENEEYESSSYAVYYLCEHGF